MLDINMIDFYGDKLEFYDSPDKWAWRLKIATPHHICYCRNS